MKCPKCHFDNPSDSKFCKECGTQIISSKDIPVTETLETPTDELTRGITFASRYEIIEELGKGGMGKVYRVEDKKIKEEVALKLIKPEIASDKKTIERFSNELKMARKIRHKNVCGMYDLDEEKGTHYITMEYVPGEDLKGMIRMMGQLGAGKSISIAKQVCEGLAEAHRLGVVHRDLKPSNIMIDKEGNVRIMDFGIARSLTAKGITGAGVMIGTPEYMSPEQAEVKEVDQRSDIYSLGVILYEMVTGRVPFEGETPLGIAMKHKGEMPKDPRELNAQIPEDLSQVILRCMEKDKKKRYQSAGEVRSELKGIEQGIPTTEREIPKRKPITSREITVQFSIKKLFIPALVVVALVIAAVVIWQLLPQKEVAPIPSDKPSIVVLPFEDFSQKKDQEYFCDGLADSIINALTNVRELRVPARSSAFFFKGKPRDIQEIGKSLNVETVLEGSVQKAGNRLRITAQLINVEDESLIWSQQYNRELHDVFVVQDEITMAIVNNLRLKLIGTEEAKLKKRYTENIEAFDHYSRGIFYWNKRTSNSLNKAIRHFEHATEKDPNYALAYVGLANCYNLLSYYSDVPPNESYPKAKEAVMRALVIDENLAESHNSLAYIKIRYDWDWEGAEKEFKRAISLNPNYATAHFWYSELLQTASRFDEAYDEAKRALELDPISPIINSNLAEIYSNSRQYDKAIEQLRKTLEMAPDFVYAHRALGKNYLYQQKYDEAIVEFKKTVELSGPSTVLLGAMGNAYALAGEQDKAIEILKNLEKRSKKRYIRPTTMIFLYIALGKMDKAFEWLNKAYEQRFELLIYLKVGEEYDPLRKDPRFKEMLRKVGLEK